MNCICTDLYYLLSIFTIQEKQHKIAIHIARYEQSSCRSNQALDLDKIKGQKIESRYAVMHHHMMFVHSTVCISQDNNVNIDISLRSIVLTGFPFYNSE